VLGQQRDANIATSLDASSGLVAGYADEFSAWTKLIDEQLVACRKDLSTLGAGTLVGETFLPPGSVFQKTLAGCRRVFDGIGAIVLFDPNGQAYASSSGRVPAGISSAQDEVFKVFFSSEKFFTSLWQPLLDETERSSPGAGPASPKRDTGYEIFPANSDTDEPAKERRGVWGDRHGSPNLVSV
jgi:hypothetical protein